MYPVIADLEGAQPGTLALAGFQINQILAGVLADVLQLIQLGVETGLDHAAVAQHRGRVVDHGAFQQLGQLRVGAYLLGQIAQMRCFQRLHAILQCGQGGQRVAQACQIARPRRAQGNPGKDAFDVADALELWLQVEVELLVKQGTDAVLASAQDLEVPQGAIQPPRHQAAAHGRCSMVEHVEQGIVTATGQILVDFQIAAAGAVDDHAVFKALLGDAADVRQGGALGFLGIAQQRTGGAEAEGQVLTVEADQILGAELLGEGLEGAVLIELPGGAATHGAATLDWRVAFPVIGNQQLGRCQALQLPEQSLPAAQFHDHKTATVDVERSQAEAAFGAHQRGQQVVTALIEQCFITDRAGSNDAGNLALDRALAGGRIANLLTDDNRLAQFDQLGQIALGGMERDAGHRNRLAAGLAPCGQGDIEQTGGFFRVVVEQFVKVTHAVEQELFGMLLLDAEVLLHHRRVGGGFGFALFHQ